MARTGMTLRRDSSPRRSGSRVPVAVTCCSKRQRIWATLRAKCGTRRRRRTGKVRRPSGRSGVDDGRRRSCSPCRLGGALVSDAGRTRVRVGLERARPCTGADRARLAGSGIPEGPAGAGGSYSTHTGLIRSGSNRPSFVAGVMIA